MRQRSLIIRILCLLLATLPLSAQNAGWPTYGGDPGGQRFSSATQITPANVGKLQPAWTFHTHALDKPRFADSQASFEATPVLAGDTLFFTSPFDKVFAIDAATGQQRWFYEPNIVLQRKDMIVTSRGVALWGNESDHASCAFRILLGTLDARLIALDGHTGALCPGFGSQGSVDLTQGVHFRDWGGYGLTSPPTVLGNVIVVGSSVADNHEVGPESGLVRGYDAITGHQLWQWEPIPWGDSTQPRTGAANVWSTISADPALGLVFLPTSSPAPDYYGGIRKGDNRDADSVVALDAKTGRKVWAFQDVHHDIWDYDIPAQPVLFTWHGSTPALAIVTKTGQVFVLDRRTGLPLIPVSERPVPQTDIPGEQTSATQPFSDLPPLTSMNPQEGDPNGWQRPATDAQSCKSQLAALRYEGPYTPVNLSGALLFPGNLGGINWGGAAIGPSGVLYANVNREAFRIRLVKRLSWGSWWQVNGGDVRDFPVWLYFGGGVLILNVLWQFNQHRRRSPRAPRRPWLPRGWPLITGLVIMAVAAPMCLFPMQHPVQHFGYELSQQFGSPYLIEREPITDSQGLPCVAPPWGALAALDLNAGRILWRTPLGTRVPGQHTGAPAFGGPIASAGGLVYTAAVDDRLRAFDALTGKELWSGQLPASARSTPMTYALQGRQFIVIAAGGHGGLTGTRGDALVAFALPTNSSIH
jgi:quinoprotein glucose dehydrogenase